MDEDVAKINLECDILLLEFYWSIQGVLMNASIVKKEC